MTVIKIYTEIGIGNRYVISTEVEKGAQERRVAGCMAMQVKDIYVRLWIGYTVYILSWRDGYKKMRKSRRAFKCLLGVGGVRRERRG